MYHVTFRSQLPHDLLMLLIRTQYCRKEHIDTYDRPPKPMTIDWELIASYAAGESQADLKARDFDLQGPAVFRVQAIGADQDLGAQGCPGAA